MFREYIVRAPRFLATRINDLDYMKYTVNDEGDRIIVHTPAGDILYATSVFDYVILFNGVHSIMARDKFYRLYELSINEQISDAEFNNLVDD